ncbi:E2.1.1.103 [Acanthosepion pharaonis]|uniref:phosphoethanolamine N-methyltransferase n=1 Tax=Acanthosepion pharaonis TaxID=158019 RepID=A0A812DD83_ACAPH|nr:E2.1.1.103 [Sepia pharaonis]
MHRSIHPTCTSTLVHYEEKVGKKFNMADFWPIHCKTTSSRTKRSTDEDEFVTQNILKAISQHTDVSDCNVIQIGAHNCLLSKEIASKCKSLLIFDCNKDFLSSNRTAVGEKANVKYCGDNVLQVDQPADSVNIVIIDEMLQYFDGKDMQALLERILTWLKKDGYFLCLESCHSIKESSDKSEGEKSSCRDFGFYHAAFQLVSIDSADSHFGLDVVFSQTLQYTQGEEVRKSPTLWMMIKDPISEQCNHGFKTFQEFLDSKQYSVTGILRYEKVFGRCFVSTGGLDTTKKFVAKLNIKPGEKVLDVGCGIGGSAFHMAQIYGAEVVGIDLSTNMILIAHQRCQEVNLTQKVHFEIADATKRHFEPCSFDVIYSRDTIIHIKDKLALFKKFYEWLKPGGRLLITDYCCSAGSHSDQFKSYTKQRGYIFLPVEKYGQELKEAGFQNIQSTDMTDHFIEILHNEKNKVHNMKKEFIQQFSVDDYNAIISGWEEKVQRCKYGDQKWGHFMAEKLAST